MKKKFHNHQELSIRSAVLKKNYDGEIEKHHQEWMFQIETKLFLTILVVISVSVSLNSEQTYGFLPKTVGEKNRS